MQRRLLTLLVVACFATLPLALAACGGDDSSSADTEVTETVTTEETETTDTETETTETEETEETETTETSAVDDFASAENCQEFAQIGSKISGALTGSVANPDEIKQAFEDLAAAAPDDIKADFETLANYMADVADALQGVDLTSPTPDPEALAKLQNLDSAGATTASQNISAWVQENCT